MTEWTPEMWTPEMKRICEKETDLQGLKMFSHRDNPEDGPCKECAEKLASQGAGHDQA